MFHALDHIQVVLVHKCRLFFVVFSLLVHTAVLATEIRKRILWNTYRLNDAIFVFHLNFAVIVGFSYLHTQNDWGLDLPFVGASGAAAGVEFFERSAVVWATALVNVCKFAVYLGSVVACVLI